MKYYIFTLGCQYNIYESEQIEKKLSKIGLKKAADEKSATFIVTNVCSVRQKPIDRIYGKLKVWKKLKETNPELKTIATGCILPRDKKLFKQKFDLVFNIGELDKLSKFIKKETNNLSSISKLEYTSNNKKVGYIPITSGCNNFCSYCAVPYTRGREKSFPKKQIIKTARDLIQSGKKEIVLLGQNVNSYKYGFAKLLAEIANINGNFKLSFLSPHPKDTTPELIKVIAKNKKIKKELHLPMQSGNNRILKLMNRNYTREDYLKLVDMIRKIIPNIRLTTDIIVGFPSETKKEFEDTYKICKKIKFGKAYISMYSPRPSTIAAKKYKDAIDQKEKRRRWLKLDKLINHKA